MFTKVYEQGKSFIKENYKSFIVFILLIVLFGVELPYKVYTPGGMVNLETRIEVENGFSSEGELGMAYVSVVKGTLPFLALSYLLPNWDLVPDEEITYENETMEETMKKDKLMMEQSMDHAIISAYRLAEKEIHILKENAHITYIDDKANTDLQLFDILKTVGDEEVSDLDQLREIVQKQQDGDRLNLKVLRNNEEVEAYAIVYRSEDDLKIGVSLTTTYEYVETPKVTITAKESESGPSGGLMMSLAIYNALVEEDITKGKKIIGTGTIDLEGNVGEIGGVEYKLLGAVKKNCDVFLVPKGNLEEALKIQEEKKLRIKIIGVASLKEALEELKKL